MSGYLGDKETMVVHHLGNMKNECKIYNIKTVLRQYFTPDTIKIAMDWGFKPCPHCN